MVLDGPQELLLGRFRSICGPKSVEGLYFRNELRFQLAALILLCLGGMLELSGLCFCGLDLLVGLCLAGSMATGALSSLIAQRSFWGLLVCGVASLALVLHLWINWTS